MNAKAEIERVTSSGVPSLRYVPSRFNVVVPLKGKAALIYNTNSQGFWKLGSAGLSCLNEYKEEGDSAEQEDIRHLIENGFLVDNQVDELSSLESGYNASRNDSSFMMLTIAPTLGCNFGCSYCFQGTDKEMEKMSEATASEIYDHVLSNIGSIKTLKIVWYGGEPLNDRRSIYALSEKFVALCRKRSVNYSAMIVTNGYQLDSVAIKKLSSLGVRSAQITIDGGNEVHDTRRPLLSGKSTFEKITANIKTALSESEMYISIRMNIDRNNAESYRDLVDELLHKGLYRHPRLSIYFAAIDVMTPECSIPSEDKVQNTNFALLEAQAYTYAVNQGVAVAALPPKFKGNCTAVTSQGLVIAPNGDLHKCWDTIQDPSRRMGHISDPASAARSPMATMWNVWSPFASEVCRDCSLLPLCTGSCGYKFLYSQPDNSADGGTLPCPSWKFNIAEKLFDHAVRSGVCTSLEWDDQRSCTTPDMVGQSHSNESLIEAKKAVAKRIFAIRNEVDDHAKSLEEAEKLLMSQGKEKEKENGDHALVFVNQNILRKMRTDGEVETV